jgi:hypothetical protein
MSNLFTEYLQQAYVPKVTANILRNNFWFSQPYFEIVPASACPGGPAINLLIETAHTSTAASYTQGDASVAAGTLAQKRAYFNKDYWQDTQEVFYDTMSQISGVNGTVADVSPEGKCISTAVANLVDIMGSAFLADLATQVDSTTALGDGSLARVANDIASYEFDAYSGGANGALTRGMLSNAIEALQDLQVPSNDMVILCPSGQHTNIANFTGVAYSEFVVDAQSASPVDVGNKFRTLTFEQIPIAIVPNMTTTELMIVRKSAVKIYQHREITVDPLGLAGASQKWLAFCGANIVNSDPRRAAKLVRLVA